MDWLVIGSHICNMSTMANCSLGNGVGFFFRLFIRMEEELLDLGVSVSTLLDL